MGWIVAVAVPLIPVLALIIFTVRFVRNRINASVQEIQVRFPNAKRVWAKAQCFGQESRGKMQLRGSGLLVLTEQELFFQMWVPKREISIPLAQIQSLEITKSHLGKTTFRDLVKVHFTNAEGQPDSIAWDAGSSREVKELIESVLPR